MIVSIGKGLFLNLNSGLFVRFDTTRRCRIVTPNGYPMDLEGDDAEDLLWALQDIALDTAQTSDSLETE